MINIILFYVNSITPIYTLYVVTVNQTIGGSELVNQRKLSNKVELTKEEFNISEQYKIEEKIKNEHI